MHLPEHSTTKHATKRAFPSACTLVSNTRSCSRMREFLLHLLRYEARQSTAICKQERAQHAKQNVRAKRRWTRAAPSRHRTHRCRRIDISIEIFVDVIDIYVGYRSEVPETSMRRTPRYRCSNRDALQEIAMEKGKGIDGVEEISMRSIRRDFRPSSWIANSVQSNPVMVKLDAHAKCNLQDDGYCAEFHVARKEAAADDPRCIPSCGHSARATGNDLLFSAWCDCALQLRNCRDGRLLSDARKVGMRTKVAPPHRCGVTLAA